MEHHSFGSCEGWEATYLGVDRYGEPETVIARAPQFLHRFAAGAEVRALPIRRDEQHPYRIENRLKVGRRFFLRIEEGVLAEAREVCEEPPHVVPGIAGIPALWTLKNLLSTALMPVGSTLYVFGGGWNWQDSGIGDLPTGLSADWGRFFLEQDERYTYRDPDGDPAKKNPCESIYPYGGFNAYHYAGLDCSGYIAWVLCNALGETLRPVVGNAASMAGRLSSAGLGERLQTTALLPGDIVSIPGHVYLVLGVCADGSLCILHSTPSPSRAGQPGGGVQLGAVGEAGCEALRLSRAYMEATSPDWFRRYDACLKDPKTYLQYGEGQGVFRWRLGAPDGLTDPEGLRACSAAQILTELRAGRTLIN